MRHLLISIAAFALLLAPQSTLGDDLEDLKAAHERGTKLNFSLDPKDLDAAVELFHEDAIEYFPASIFPVRRTKEQNKKWRENLIATIESFAYAPVSIEYRVVGNTGIVFQIGTLVTRPKNNPVTIQNLRFSHTYIKTGGKWLIYAVHTAAIQPGN